MGFFSGPMDGPASFFVFWRLMDKRSWALFISYICIAAGVVGAFAILAMAWGPELREYILAYMFPEHWRLAGDMMFDKLFGNLGPQVLANFILQGGMAAISMTCFAIKEMMSRRIEHQNNLIPEGHAPWPLWRQAIEEIKFAVLYLVAYNLIFWIAYPPYETSRFAAKILSFATLFIFFNITFLCPLFLRHRIGYGRMIRTFFRRPFAAFGFAGFFLAPSLIAAYLLKGQPLPTMTGLLLAIHVLTVAPAAAAGTWVASRMLPTAKTMKPARIWSRIVAVLFALGVLAASFTVLGKLAESIHTKSQILKCEYRVDWSSFKLDLPSLSDLSVGLSMDIEITNPTAIDVRIENSRLEVTNNKKNFSTVQLGPMEVPAGQTRRQEVSIRVEIILARLLEYKDLLNKEWEFTLWMEIEDGYEFPVYFR